MSIADLTRFIGETVQLVRGSKVLEASILDISPNKDELLESILTLSYNSKGKECTGQYLLLGLGTGFKHTEMEKQFKGDIKAYRERSRQIAALQPWQLEDNRLKCSYKTEAVEVTDVPTGSERNL